MSSTSDSGGGSVSDAGGGASDDGGSGATTTTMALQQAAPEDCPSEGGIIIRPTDEQDDGAAATPAPGDTGLESGSGLGDTIGAAAPAPTRIETGGGWLARDRGGIPLGGLILLSLFAAGLASAAWWLRHRAPREGA